MLLHGQTRGEGWQHSKILARVWSKIRRARESACTKEVEKKSGKRKAVCPTRACAPAVLINMHASNSASRTDKLLRAPIG